MDFRILGPLEVDEAGRAIPIVSGRQRALLAILLVHANKPVSTDRLIDELWGEHPPASVRKGLQVLVSRLRKTLGKGSARLATQPDGYLLHVEPGELDLDRCERLGRQGREALARGDCRPAAEQLREALGLGAGRRLPSSRSSRSRRRKSAGSKSCGSHCSRTASTRTWRAGRTPPWSASSKRSWLSIPCANACVGS